MSEQKICYPEAGKIMTAKFPSAKQQTGPDGDRWVLNGENVGSYNHKTGVLRITNSNSFSNGRARAEQEIRNKIMNAGVRAKNVAYTIAEYNDGKDVRFDVKKDGKEIKTFKSRLEAEDFILYLKAGDKN